MLVTTQEIYAAAQDMENRSRFGRAALIRAKGGKVSTASNGWRVELLTIVGTGSDLNLAIENWIRAAQMACRLDLTRRATDLRHDCPYNGQPPLPEHSPLAEA
ncbi:hypothetical protein [Phaeobacter italicus]|jgi:hypothetical protein|uniref:hypothetical protein n=1 Tax=Phaeobacter italicus TaxID=481446 RepID=UPI002FDE4DB8